MKPNRLITIVTLVTFLTGCASGTGFVSVESKFPKGSYASSFHTVEQGETLYSIAWNYNIAYKELAGANGIPYPYTIYPGQKIDVSGRRVAANTSYSPPTSSVSKPSKTPAQKTARASTAAQLPQYAPPDEPVSAAPQWQWPANGRLIARYSTSEPVNKGIDINGSLGEPVLASAAGTVVYAGQGLRGYGNLIIVKHNDTFLSAYAHTSRILVSEQEVIKAGQKIAEIGSTGTDKVKLHFEIRQNGMPVDPLQYLPARPG